MKLHKNINIIYQDPNITSYLNKWEYFKFRARQIKHSKMKSAISKQKEEETIKENNKICNKPSLSEPDKQQMYHLQTCLGDIYTTKAKGAYLRSRAKWIENGEKSTVYFCRLERKRQEKNSIKSLMINDNLCTDPKLISNEISNFL